VFTSACHDRCLAIEISKLSVGFTDGISEAMNFKDEEWARRECCRRSRPARANGAADMIPSVMAAADRFADGAPQHDDITLVIVKLDAAWSDLPFQSLW